MIFTPDSWKSTVIHLTYDQKKNVIHGETYIILYSIPSYYSFGYLY